MTRAFVPWESWTTALGASLLKKSYTRYLHRKHLIWTQHRTYSYLCTRPLEAALETHTVCVPGSTACAKKVGMQQSLKVFRRVRVNRLHGYPRPSLIWISHKWSLTYSTNPLSRRAYTWLRQDRRTRWPQWVSFLHAMSQHIMVTYDSIKQPAAAFNRGFYPNCRKLNESNGGCANSNFALHPLNQT